MLRFLCCCFLCAQFFSAQAQTSAPSTPASLSRNDSIRLSKMNNTANLLLAAGVGLTGAGAYLIYNGVRVYNASVICDSLSVGGCNPEKDLETNHKQGTIFMVCGGLSCALGVALTSVGAVKKVQFKRRKKELLIQPTSTLNEVGVRFTF